MHKSLSISLALLAAALIALLSSHSPGIASGSAAIGSDSLRRGALSEADSAAALAKLAEDIEKLVALPAEKKSRKVGVEVYSLTRNAEVYDLNATLPLTPASTTKVVTVYTILAELGPDHQLKTTILADAKPKDGVIEGNLYIKGHGDPFLTVSDVDQLVEQTLAAGIKEIRGNVVGDGTFFDSVYDRFEYSGDADEVEALPPVSALSIERNSFTVIVSSPRSPGLPLNVQTYPRSSGIDIVNNGVSTAPARARSKAPVKRSKGKGKRRSYLDVMPEDPRFLDVDENVPRFGDEPMLAYAPKQSRPRRSSAKQAATTRKTTAKKGSTKKAAPTKKSAAVSKKGAAGKSTKKNVVSKKEAPAPSSPSAGPLRVSVTTQNGRQLVTVTGGQTANRTTSYRYEMKNPPAVTAGLVYDRLRAQGIRIGGQVTTGSAPQRPYQLALHERPLTSVLNYVMKNSNNYLAEYAFKIIGGAGGGRTETAKKSVEKIEQRMSIAHVPFGQCVINDGSGLSRRNCLSASTLTGILNAAYRDKKLFNGFYPLFSVAGVDGTLRKRMKGTDAQGNVHGKTGTLRNVSALTGYVTTKDGEVMSFALLMNGGNIGAYKGVQDKVAARIASFSYNEIREVAETAAAN